MGTTYKMPFVMKVGNQIIKAVKVCSNFAYSPAEMLFVSATGEEIEFDRLSTSEKMRAYKLFDLYRMGRLVFA